MIRTTFNVTVNFWFSGKVLVLFPFRFLYFHLGMKWNGEIHNDRVGANNLYVQNSFACTIYVNQVNLLIWWFHFDLFPNSLYLPFSEVLSVLILVLALMILFWLTMKSDSISFFVGFCFLLFVCFCFFFLDF